MNKNATGQIDEATKVDVQQCGKSTDSVFWRTKQIDAEHCLIATFATVPVVNHIDIDYFSFWNKFYEFNEINMQFLYDLHLMLITL